MPFAFWPTSPVVSPTWLDFLDFASARADGTWLFRGHADAAWDLVPAIGRQPSVSAYRLADEKSCSRISCLRRNALSMRTGSPSLSG